jgi:hypothetical protein
VPGFPLGFCIAFWVFVVYFSAREQRTKGSKTTPRPRGGRKKLNWEVALFWVRVSVLKKKTNAVISHIYR